MSVYHTSGLHFGEHICGAPNREALIKAFQAFCDSEYYSECYAGIIWSPEGEEVHPEISFTPGDG